MTGKVIVRTVTHYYVGEVVAKAGTGFLGLINCSWIPDTGPWSKALEKGTLARVEPYPASDTVLISLGAIVEIAPWHHELPTNRQS